MANEVKLKLAIEGGKVVGAELDGVAARLGTLDTKARAAASGSDTLGTALKGLITVGAAMALVRMADSATTLQTQLRLSSNSAGEATKAYGALFDIAQKGRVSFTELGTTYAAIARSGRELGVSQDRLLNVTQSISQAMTIGGGSAASMQAALVQLGQGLSSGTLRGEELNSIMEQTPRLAKAIADGLGVPIGKLREMGAAGELTSQQVIAALEKAGPQLAKEMASATLTVGQAFTMLSNSAVKFVGDADAASGASLSLANALKTASEAMDTVGGAIKNNEAAFNIVIYGLAGPATVAGVYALSTAIGTRLVPALVGAAVAAGPLAWITIALTAMGGAAVAAGNAFTQSHEGMAISAAQLANQISALDKNAAAGLNDRGYKATEEDKRASAARRAELVEKKQLIDQTMVMRTVDEGAATAAQSSRSAHARLAKDAVKDRADFAKAGEAYYSKDQKNQVMLNAEIDKTRALFEKGSISATEYAQRINAVQASFAKDAPKKTGLSEAQKQINDGLALYNDLLDAGSGYAASYAEDQNKLAAAFKSGGIASYADYAKAVQLLLDKQPLMKDAVKAQETAAKAYDDALKGLQGSAANEAESLTKAIDAQRLHNAEIGKTPEQVELAKRAEQDRITEMLQGNADILESAITLAAAQDDFDKATLTLWDEKLKSLRDQVTLRGQLAGELTTGAALAGADELAKANKKAAEESGKYWEDALMRAFESGKGFFQSLWDTIKNTMKTQVLKVLISATGLTGMTTASAGADASGGGGVGNLLGVAGNLSSLYDTVSKGFAGVSAGVTNMLSTTSANMAGTGLDGMLSANGAYGTAANSGWAATAGTAAGYAAGAAAGLAIGNAISGQFGSANTVTAGTIIGSIVGGPIGGAIGGAIGGLVNRAFGMGNTEVTSSGTRGTFSSANSFSGQNYTNYHQDGGWFRGDDNWTDTSAIDAKTVTAWQTAFVGVKQSVASMATSLGLSTNLITSYTKYIDVAAGTTAEQMTAIFTGMADEMTTAAAPAIASFAKTGEGASTTLIRLSTSLSAVNQWIVRLDKSALSLSLSGGDAASKLIDLFGTVDAFAASSKAYYDAYFTTADHVAQTTLDVAKALALVGVALPASKDAFRDVVTALDLTTEAGRNTYAVMMAVAPEFATVADAATAATQKINQAFVTLFSDLGKTLDSLLSNIASARGAVADSVAGINPTNMTLAQIKAGIAGSQVGLPSNAGVLGAIAGQTLAASKLSAAEGVYKAAQAAGVKTEGEYAAKVSTAQGSMASTVGYYQGLAAKFQARAVDYAIHVNATGTNNDAYSYNAATNRLNGWQDISSHSPSGRSYGDFLGDAQRFKNEMYGNGTVAALVEGNTALAAAAKAVTAAQTDYTKAVNGAGATTNAANLAMTKAATVLATADEVAKQAATDYAKALTVYAGDAEKATAKLGKLREETVKYYEAQAALAQLMGNSAANLRAAVASISTSQLDPAAATAQKQREFAQYYSLALSTSGADKAAYADKMTAALPALSEAIKSTSTLRDWTLATARLAAQSSTVAGQLDAAAAVDYQADSLATLQSIDATLAGLEAGTNTAAGIISAAVAAGADLTAAGLRNVVKTLGGVPSFDVGTNYVPHDMLARVHQGEAIVPKRYNTGATGLSGNNAELLAALRALQDEVAELRKSNTRENMAALTHAALTADATGRMDKQGVLVFTDPAEPLKTQVAA